MELKDLIEAWRGSIIGEGKSWVIFENGTCVIIMNPETDLAQQATELLREWGPVYPGTTAGDFSTIKLQP